jgi:hypothetical protein
MFKTHAIAATAFLLAAGASHAAAQDQDHDAIKLTRPHHDATAAAINEVKTSAPVRDNQSDAPHAPEPTMHDMGPHRHATKAGKDASEPANTETLTVHNADRGRAREPLPEAIMPPRDKSIFFRPSAIDKNMMRAIGLLRPKKAFTASVVKKPAPQTLPSNASNVFGMHGKETPGAMKSAAFAGISPPAGAHNFALAPAGAVAARVRPQSPAIHDAIVNGTGVRRPASVMASIGGAPIRKPTFALSGSDVHLKMR